MSANAIIENSKPLANAAGVKFLRMDGDRALYVKLAEEGARRAFRSELDCAWALHRHVGEWQDVFLLAVRGAACNLRDQ